MIFKVAPKYGTKNPMVYLSICSLVGSVSVMAIKVSVFMTRRGLPLPPADSHSHQGFGIALKLTFAGNNQLTHAPTYLFGLVVVFCILIQMVIPLEPAQGYQLISPFNPAELFQQGSGHVFDKCVSRAVTFPEAVAYKHLRSVNPIYYVFFSTSTILASAILFQGFNTTGGSESVSLICGFMIIFMGVYLLNISRQSEVKHHTAIESGIISKCGRCWLFSHANNTSPKDPRMSMSGRPSMDAARTPLWGGGSATYNSDGSNEPAHGRRSDIYHSQDTTLFNAFEEEESVGLRPMRVEFGDDSDESDATVERPEGMLSNKDLTRINTNINRSNGQPSSRAKDSTAARF